MLSCHMTYSHLPYRTDFSFRCAAFKLNKIGLNIATLWMPLGL